ncbi:MAG: hypothetical protein ACK4VO_02670 [Pseudobdellovibrio sp.]
MLSVNTAKTYILTILFAPLTGQIANAAIKPSSVWKTSGVSEAFQSQKVPDIAFYKTKESPFPSGYTTLERLKEKVIKTDDGIEYALQHKQNYFAAKDLKFVTAFHLSQKWIEKYSRRKVNPDLTKTMDEIYLNYETDPLDRGLILITEKTNLYDQPQVKSKSTIEVPVGISLIPITFINGFAKVFYQKKFGYIDINASLSKFDFARFAIDFNAKNNSWSQVLRRDFDQLITNKKIIHFAKTRALAVDEYKAIVLEDTQWVNIQQKKDTLKKYSNLQFRKIKTESWALSELKGHGQIWWKIPKFKAFDQKTLSINELIKKDIISVSFDPENPKKGILSSDGVYMTQDGENWREIPQFKGFSGPVYYVNDKIFFIGNFKTLDGGQTFENYIQVEKLSDVIQTYTGYSPKKMKITKIKIQKPMSVVVDINTGYTDVKLKSPLFIQDWKVVR